MMECRSYTTARPLINAVTMFVSSTGKCDNENGCHQIHEYVYIYMLCVYTINM